jgi:dUTPase
MCSISFHVSIPLLTKSLLKPYLPRSFDSISLLMNPGSVDNDYRGHNNFIKNTYRISIHIIAKNTISIQKRNKLKELV